MKIEKLYTLYKKHYKVTTDTRLDLTDSIFFALKGGNFNGNLFAEKALNKGASYAIVDEKKHQTNKNIIWVEDVLQTLQDLAKYHREQLNIPVIALTGSNGKTTTKELIQAVLKEKYTCVATKGNLNNHIGVPLTLLSVLPETEIMVVEMGANHPNEIAMLCEIAKPDYGYITNYGKVHLEGFINLEGVIKAKTELYKYLQTNNKTVFVNTDDAVQVLESKEMNVLSFGKKDANYPIKYINANPFVRLIFDNIDVQSKLIGKYNYLNIATAIAIGKYFKVPNNSIKNGIENYVPTNNRSQIIEKGSNKIIMDACNANPNSMKVALENLEQLTAKNKIAILGDMFEIGESSQQEHQNIVDIINLSNLSDVFLIGANFLALSISNKKINTFKTFQEFKEKSRNLKIENATILIKASRGMALERVLELL